MNLSERPAGRAKLIGGRLCLDFVNSVGGRMIEPSAKKKIADGVIVQEDKLSEYADLVAWSLHAGVVTEAEAARLLRESKQREKDAASVFARALALREAIWRICRAVVNQTPPRQSDLDLLNQELAIAHGRVRLAAGEKNFVWEWTDTKNSLDRMLWLVADSAAEYLTTGDLSRLRECGGENCGWLFDDTSRNRSRQWCDMQDCGNLAKIRRFRSRLHA
jgi:predicted RNA-binding Zn ribbon-like protein